MLIALDISRVLMVSGAVVVFMIRILNEFHLILSGTSMQPALNPSVGSEDYVFLSKWSVKEMGVERGDIISLISPKDPSQKLIKRVVGLEGK